MAFLAPVGAWVAANAATLATVASVAGTAASVAGGVMSANAQTKAMEANARLKQQEGLLKQEAAKQETYKLSKERTRTLGTQRALYGMAGVDLLGSPLEVMADTAAQYERDIALKGYAGDVGLQVSQGESDIMEFGAKNATTAGYINAGGTLLTGFGRALLGKHSPGYGAIY